MVFSEVFSGKPPWSLASIHMPVSRHLLPQTTRKAALSDLGGPSRLADGAAAQYAESLSRLFATPSDMEERCNALHPWIMPSVERRFEFHHNWAMETMRAGPRQRTFDLLNESFAAHGPAEKKFKGLASLYYNGSTPTALLLWAGGAKSMEGLAAPALAAMARHQADLLPRLSEPLHLFWTMLDFPILGRRSERRNKHRLPHFAMCGQRTQAEIPVPDFTFHSYGKLSGREPDTSWAAISRRLREGAEGRQAWRLRQRRLTFRGTVSGSRMRRALVPNLMACARNETAVPLDVQDTCCGARKRAYRLNLTEQCRSRYLLHLEGNAYSASLKYKLACGSLVLLIDSSCEEFYYPALQAHKTHVPIQLSKIWSKNEDLIARDFRATLLPDLRAKLAYYESAEGGAAAARIAAAGQRFAAEQLGQGAISCYWYAVLRHSLLLQHAQHPGGQHATPESRAEHEADVAAFMGSVRYNIKLEYTEAGGFRVTPLCHRNEGGSSESGVTCYKYRRNDWRRR